MEYLNNLLDYKNMKIYQDSDWFKFSLDSVLLPNFVTINTRDKNIMDLGTGNAPIPLILSTRTKANIYAVEIQKELFELATKSVAINKLEKQITLLNLDIKDLKEYFKPDSIDIITTNPPYFKMTEASRVNMHLQKTIARHEVLISLDDILEISRYLLRNNGTFAMVHRTDRLVEILILLKKYNIEPKRLRLVYPKVGEESNIILIEGTKNGKEGLKVLPPLYVHEDTGEYTFEVKEMFKGE